MRLALSISLLAVSLAHLCAQGPSLAMLEAARKEADRIYALLPPPPPGVYRPREPGVTSPTVVQRTAPEYTEQARQAKANGTVTLAAVIDVDGKVQDVVVVESMPYGLDKASVNTLRKWKFKPGTKDGVPVPVQVIVPFSFHML